MSPRSRVQAPHGISYPIVKDIVARLAQLVERKTFNLVVVGSSPTAGYILFFFHIMAWLAEWLRRQT